MANTVEIILEGVDNASDVLKNVAGAMTNVAAIAGGALAAGLALSVKEALDAEKTQAALAQVLKSTGNQAGLTQDKANELAQQFKDLAGGSDDAILALETIGLRAGTIAADQMPAFIQTSLDLGAVLGDNASAAELLARAQEDPLAAMARLNKAGIVFSASLKDQIKQLVKTGDTAGATALILDRVGEATGGAAAANADTLSGKWEVLQGRLLDAAEGIGTALLPVLTDLFDNVIAPALPIIEELATGFGLAIQALTEGDIGGAFDVLGEFFNNVLPGSAELFYSLGGAANEFFDSLANGTNQLQPIFDAFQNLFAAIQEQMPAMQSSGQAFIDWLQGAFGILGPQLIENLTGAVNSLAEIWRQHGDEITEVVRIAFEIIVATIGGAFTLLSGIVTAGLELLNGDWDGAWKTMQDTFTAFMNMVLSIAGTDLPAFVEQWRTNWELLQIIINKVLMDMTAGIQTWIINTINTLKGYYEQFKQIGADLIGNITLGVMQGVDLLIKAAKGAVESAISAAGGALGGALGGAATVAGVGHNAEGTDFWQGGLTWVGEKGPELVNLPRGSQVIPNNELGGGGTVIVQVDGQTLFSIMLAQGKANGLTMAQVA